MERETGIEPATNSLEGCDSTTELLPPSRLAPCAHTRHYGEQARFPARPLSLALRRGKLRLRGTLSALPPRGGGRPPAPGSNKSVSRTLSRPPSRSSRSEQRLVARGGFEPPKPLGRQIYSLLRLTAPQPRQLSPSAARAARHALSLHESGHAFVVLGKRCFLVLTCRSPNPLRLELAEGFEPPTG
jgi:hypothetical protein